MTDREPKDYRGAHRAPSPDFGAPFHNVAEAGMFPEDFYTSKGPQWYGSGYPRMDVATHSQLNSIRNKPDALVHVYRAVPADAKRAEINPGDWVTPTRDYAVQHGISNLNGQYKLVSKKVPAKHLWTNGDSMHEWGYNPK